MSEQAKAETPEEVAARAERDRKKAEREAKQKKRLAELEKKAREAEENRNKYNTIKKQQEELEKTMKEIKNKVKREEVRKMKKICREFGISATNLKGSLKTKKKKAPKTEKVSVPVVETNVSIDRSGLPYQKK